VKTYRLLLLALLVVPLVGCKGDSDPNAKINEPGYYNGPKSNPKANGPAAEPDAS
jgi:hypothetical protein